MLYQKIESFLKSALVCTAASAICACSSGPDTRYITVVDFDTNEPIEDAMVYVTGSTDQIPYEAADVYLTDADGEIELYEWGNLHVIAGKEGYWITAGDIAHSDRIRLAIRSRPPDSWVDIPSIENAQNDEDAISKSVYPRWQKYCKTQLEDLQKYYDDAKKQADKRRSGTKRFIAN